MPVCGVCTPLPAALPAHVCFLLLCIWGMMAHLRVPSVRVGPVCGAWGEGCSRPVGRYSGGQERQLGPTRSPGGAAA